MNTLIEKVGNAALEVLKEHVRNEQRGEQVAGEAMHAVAGESVVEVLWEQRLTINGTSVVLAAERRGKDLLVRLEAGNAVQVFLDAHDLGTLEAALLTAKRLCQRIERKEAAVATRGIRRIPLGSWRDPDSDI